MTIIQHNFDDVYISQTDEDMVIGDYEIPKGYVNLTEMCKCNSKKKLNDYLRLDSTKEYIPALAKSLEVETGIPPAPMVIIVQGSFSGISTLQGTWGHIEVAIDLARWISIPFRIWANRVLRYVLNNEFEALTEEAEKAKLKLDGLWKEVRISGISVRKSLTKSIQDWYTNNPGGTTRPLHAMISTVTNLIYQKLWGMDAKQLEDHLGCGRHELRDYLDPSSLRILERAEDNVIEFISEDNIKPVDAVPLANLRAKPLPTRQA